MLVDPQNFTSIGVIKIIKYAFYQCPLNGVEFSYVAPILNFILALKGQAVYKPPMDTTGMCALDLVRRTSNRDLVSLLGLLAKIKV